MFYAQFINLGVYWFSLSPKLDSIILCYLNVVGKGKIESDIGKEVTGKGDLEKKGDGDDVFKEVGDGKDSMEEDGDEHEELESKKGEEDEIGDGELLTTCYEDKVMSVLACANIGVETDTTKNVATTPDEAVPHLKNLWVADGGNTNVKDQQIGNPPTEAGSPLPNFPTTVDCGVYPLERSVLIHLKKHHGKHIIDGLECWNVLIIYRYDLNDKEITSIQIKLLKPSLGVGFDGGGVVWVVAMAVVLQLGCSVIRVACPRDSVVGASGLFAYRVVTLTVLMILKANRAYSLFQVLVAAVVIFGELRWWPILQLLLLGLLRREVLELDSFLAFLVFQWLLGGGGFVLCSGTLGWMARGGSGRGRARTHGGIYEGLRSGVVAEAAGVGVGILPGVQIHQGTLPTPVIPEQAGILPVTAASGVSAKMKQFMEGTIVKTPILWASFRDRFFDQYFPKSYRHACISEFYMLEQGDMSISRYDQGFNELSRYVMFIINDEEQRKMKFLKGLHPYFRRFLITSGANTYREVLFKALALEQNDVEDRKSKDLRGQQRQDQRLDKGKVVQTQYDSLGLKRQREFLCCSRIFDLYMAILKRKLNFLGMFQSIEEAEWSLHDAIMMIRRALKNSTVVAGGGAIDMEISQYLRQHARTIVGKFQLFTNAYARALEVIPRQQLCDNVVYDATDVLNQLRQKHALPSSEGALYGVDVHTSGIAYFFVNIIWEPSVVKINTLNAAAEVTCLVLGMDETVKSPKVCSSGFT
ncbi:hypothetical protein GIB67_008171 [Kingdonia uniflora]|uniref:Retrotransposon gag domain-containing protein n=1 Tax=Kingdonia uniflora TaxID=39325 RepID=A0A7J7LUN3_9MAGN|nr:hypothetical protein GIB67_008171 [Kingdonia uniflora]